MSSKSLLLATEGGAPVRSIFGRTSKLMTPSAPSTAGNMFAITTTTSRFNPNLGKSAHWALSVSESIGGTPVHPMVGSAVSDTATRKLFGILLNGGLPSPSTATANQRPDALS